MLKVKQVAEQQKLQALQLLYSQHNERDRQSYLAEILKAEQDGQLNLDGLYLAEDDSKPVGVGLCILQADGTAYAWPPVVVTQLRRHSTPERQSEVEDAIVQAMTACLQQKQAWLSQVLLNCDDVPTRQIFLRNGYQHFTDLLFMSRTINSDPDVRNGSEAEWVVYDPEQTHQRFVHVIEQTYIDSQDCPELNDIRTAEQALRSYQISGEFNPALWFLLHAEGVDLGVLLLTAHPDEQCCELVYCGLIPAARGNRWGEKMMAFAIRKAYQSGFRSLFLAVDNRNRPAIHLYHKMGFTQSSTRAVCAKVLQAVDGHQVR